MESIVLNSDQNCLNQDPSLERLITKKRNLTFINCPSNTFMQQKLQIGLALQQYLPGDVFNDFISYASLSQKKDTRERLASSE